MEAALPKDACSVFDAILSRRAVRAFRSEPVPRSVIEDILSVAARAPSGSNIQPWKVWVLTGAALDRAVARIVAAYLTEDDAHQDEWQYYPKNWSDPYISRRRKLGIDLYKLAGVAKGDEAAAREHIVRNLRFFGAPVGMFVTIERQMEAGSWLDSGGFIQSVLLAARGFGLDTCPQQIFSRFHQVIRAAVEIPDDEIVLCGIALGYEDSGASVNQLVTEREDVSSFATFRET